MDVCGFLYIVPDRTDVIFDFLVIIAAGLYQAICSYVLSKPVISELTVEDPAEAFEDLRDRNDLRMLLSHEQFMKEAFGDKGIGASSSGGKVTRKKAGASGKKIKNKLDPPADKAWMEKWRKDLKIAGVRSCHLFHFNTDLLMKLPSATI